MNACVDYRMGMQKWGLYVVLFCLCSVQLTMYGMNWSGDERALKLLLCGLHVNDSHVSAQHEVSDRRVNGQLAVADKSPQFLELQECLADCSLETTESTYNQQLRKTQSNMMEHVVRLEGMYNGLLAAQSQQVNEAMSWKEVIVSQLLEDQDLQKLENDAIPGAQQEYFEICQEYQKAQHTPKGKQNVEAVVIDRLKNLLLQKEIDIADLRTQVLSIKIAHARRLSHGGTHGDTVGACFNSLSALPEEMHSDSDSSSRRSSSNGESVDVDLELELGNGYESGRSTSGEESSSSSRGSRDIGIDADQDEEGDI